jgi:CelD/BcsL family acetyltransferase involved in cellulose biosynthesis
MGVQVVVRPRLDDLAEEWDSLVEALPLPSPFLRAWWLEGTAGPSTLFVLVVESDRLVGGVALERDEFRGLERLREAGHDLAPDHLDLLAAPGRDQEVVGALRGWFRSPGDRLIELAGLSETTRLGEALPGPVYRDAIAVAPFTALPPSFDDYIAAHSAARKSTKDSLRRMSREAEVTHHVVHREAPDGALDRLKSLHREAWGEASGFLPRFDRFARAASEGIHRGEMVIHELRADQEVVASQVMFVVAGRASHYQGGRSGDRRWGGSGSVLMSRVIERACQEGLVEFDCLRGDSSYKRNWAGAERSVIRVRAGYGARGRSLQWAMVRGGLARRWVGRRVRPLRSVRRPAARTR